VEAPAARETEAAVEASWAAAAEEAAPPTSSDPLAGVTWSDAAAAEPAPWSRPALGGAAAVSRSGAPAGAEGDESGSPWAPWPAVSESPPPGPAVESTPAGPAHAQSGPSGPAPGQPAPAQSVPSGPTKSQPAPAEPVRPAQSAPPVPSVDQAAIDALGLDSDQRAWLGRSVTKVEGIGPVHGAKLEEASVGTLLELLLRGATRKGRQELAESTGLSGKQIMRWVNNADLFRLRGVGSQYADLLEAAGVDTVVELAQRRPDNLHARLVTTNELRSLVRQVPTRDQVEDWVNQAKDLPRIVAY
jgi:predicted flap endonuclease-1-like 5' DNA nuclease